MVLKIHQSKSKGPNTNLAQILIGCVQRAPESDAQLSQGDTVLPSPSLPPLQTAGMDREPGEQVWGERQPPRLPQQARSLLSSGNFKSMELWW